MTATKTKVPTPEPTEGYRLGIAKDVAFQVTGALAAGGKTYFTGVLELGRTLGGFGREVLGELAEHLRATVRVKDVHEAGALQVAWVQHRLEMSATHAKEFVDLARVKSEEVVAPFAALLKPDKVA
jgi:hypothetical protein